jgi:hypothetical protein
MSASGAFELYELLRLLLFRPALLFLQLLFQTGNGRPVECSLRNAAMLESTTIVTRAVVIVALSDHFPTADDNTSVTVMQWRLLGLLEAKGQIVVGLHFDR